jgi:hypothetical protein
MVAAGSNMTQQSLATVVPLLGLELYHHPMMLSMDWGCGDQFTHIHISWAQQIIMTTEIYYYGICYYITKIKKDAPH